MMQTGCPACATIFRITPEQLKARLGQVRCGQCGEIFNALDALVDAPSIAAAQALIQTSQTTVATEPAEPAEPAGMPLVPIAEADPDPTGAATEPDVPGHEDAPVAGSVATTENEVTPTPTPSFSELYAEPLPVTPTRVWPWVCASLLMLLLLMAQVLFQFRTEAALLIPEAKPALQAVCELLGYDLPLPRKADQLSIEASDLHPEPQHKNMLVLAATLKNRAGFAQAYPYLELTLTDTLDQPLLRKIIAPADYLAKSQAIAAGFAPGSELVVHLALMPEGSDKKPSSGYRLYLFYP
jgi:predicted Zn finger-like uncharacterized protein